MIHRGVVSECGIGYVAICPKCNWRFPKEGSKPYHICRQEAEIHGKSDEKQKELFKEETWRLK